MLTWPERILFLIAVAVSLYFTYRGFARIRGVIRRGGGEFKLLHLPRRLADAVVVYLSQRTVLNARFGPSLAHAFVAWGFTYYVLVNLGDVLQGLLPGYVFLGTGTLGNLYRLGADLLSVAVLAGMMILLLRRLLYGKTIFSFLPTTTLHPKARRGVFTDSMIVAAFILLHVGWRFLGESFQLARTGIDPWQPFASLVAGAWTGASLPTLIAMRHISWWLAIGLILAFLPYFPRTKHIHIFFAPLNYLLKPPRHAPATLAPIDFENEDLAQYGAARLEHLGRPQLVDAYACIMCNRCQDACPANATGKALSPAALEINKRYLINQEAAALAAGAESSAPLLEFAISEESIWGCTTCGACVEICPVNNEPLLDILEIRRGQVLMESAFPKQMQTAFRGMERTSNPWNVGPDARLDWAEGLDLPVIDARPQPEILWWVGCAPATEARAQAAAKAFVRILRAARVDFAVLGTRERCTGDSARRAGNEYLFAQMAQENVATLNEVKPRRIVTTCPHCLHTLTNDYPQFGGYYRVIHHTQFLSELLAVGRLSLNSKALADVAFHDPCYLGRHNGIFDDPRRVLRRAGADLRELSRNRNRSFCCGAGGAQMWKEEEAGKEKVSVNRFREVQESGAKTLAVGCPFCKIMLGDASRAAGETVPVRDVAEIVAEALEK